MAEPLSPDLPGIDDPETLYHYRLGLFHALWSSIDLVVDYSIARFLNLSDDEGHMLTSGMMFGSKARLLSGLIKRSDHVKKKDLTTALNALRGDARRDVLAHGYQFKRRDKVAFLERPRGGDFKPKMHEFTHDEFREHVVKLAVHGAAYVTALGASQDTIDAFGRAAISLDNKA